MISLAALLGLSLASGLAIASPAAARGPLPQAAVNAAMAGGSLPQGVPVRVWLEEGTDLFYPGDAVRVRFRTDDDAYVALFHLDPEGYLDLLFPASPWDDEFVHGRRTYSVAGPARGGALALGRTSGIGYLYVIASPFPLDFRFLRSRGSWQADLWGGSRMLRGDPFWALEQVTRLLVPDTRYPLLAMDVLTYHVGGRHRYPSYACYDRFGRAGAWDHYAYYPSCDRLQRLLVSHPYYYDTRRYRGSRGVYLRELDDLAPRHGFKEPVGRGAPPLERLSDPRTARPDPRGRTGQGAPAQEAPSSREPRAEPQPSTPARQRPTLERRQPDRAPERTEPASSGRSRESPPQREESRPPQREPARPPQREEARPPQREEARPEPRRPANEPQAPSRAPSEPRSARARPPDL